MTTTIDDKERLPFWEREVDCPVCGEKTIHYMLRDRTYSVNRLEDDYFISQYTWRKKEYNPYHLYAFFVWHCPHCKYTDERQYFTQKDLQEGQLRFLHFKKALQERGKDDAVIQALSKPIEYPTTDMLTVLNIHLLALYLQQLPKEKFWDIEKIARLYLRTSWIFRILSQGAETSFMEHLFSDLSHLHQSFEDEIQKSHTILDQFHRAISQTEGENEIPLWQEPYLLTHRENLLQVCQTLFHDFEKMRERSQNLKQIKEQMMNDYFAHNESFLNKPYQEFDRFYDFLHHVQHLWGEAPVREEDAIRKAEIFYKKVLNLPPYLEDRIKQFNIYKLLIVLNEKLTDYHQAEHYCTTWEKFATSMKNAAENRLERLKTVKDDSIDPNHLRSLIKRANKALEEIQLIQRRLTKYRTAKEELIAQKLSQRFQDEPPEKLEKILQKAELSDEVVKKYVQLRAEEQKKGILNIFRF
ncbi:MAG: DUF2225 domain-containing protein [Methanobacteriota archaeon]|nr:MAG: DUF2225 domain-containing protein [Euryarchaeota archaeon]